MTNGERRAHAHSLVRGRNQHQQALNHSIMERAIFASPLPEILPSAGQEEQGRRKRGVVLLRVGTPQRVHQTSDTADAQVVQRVRILVDAVLVAKHRRERFESRSAFRRVTAFERFQKRRHAIEHCLVGCLLRVGVRAGVRDGFLGLFACAFTRGTLFGPRHVAMRRDCGTDQQEIEVRGEAGPQFTRRISTKSVHGA